MYPQSTPKPLTVVFPFNKSENFQSLDCLKYLDSNLNLSLILIIPSEETLCCDANYKILHILHSAVWLLANKINYLHPKELIMKIWINLTLAFSLVIPEWLGLFEFNLLLNFGFFVEFVEVVYDDGDGQRDAENSADRANLTQTLSLSEFGHDMIIIIMTSCMINDNLTTFSCAHLVIIIASRE